MDMRITMPVPLNMPGETEDEQLAIARAGIEMYHDARGWRAADYGVLLMPKSATSRKTPKEWIDLQIAQGVTEVYITTIEPHAEVWCVYIRAVKKIADLKLTEFVLALRN